MILAIDPGKYKCGLAIIDLDKKVLEQQIFKRSEIITATLAYFNKYQILTVVVGDSSNGKNLAQEFAKQNISVALIDEKNSTLEARELFWRNNPPKGLWKLIPLSFRFPPRPVDDFAAVILAQRYLSK